MLNCSDDQRPFLLSEDAHENIYRSSITHSLEAIREVKHPIALFLGAQPGSGKTRLRESLLSQNDGVVINTDDLRWFHPAYNRLLENPATNPLGPYLVDPDATAWSIRLFNEALQQRSNVVIDSTFGGNPAHVIARLQTLHAQGYQNEFHIIAVNPRVSKLGIYLRYENGINDGNPERMVSMEVHDRNFKNLPENLMEIARTCRHLIARVVIYSRGMNRSWSPIYETSYPCDFDESIQRLNTERQRPFTADEAENFAQTIDEVSQLILRRNGNVEKFLEALSV